jgi:cytochrome c5
MSASTSGFSVPGPLLQILVAAVPICAACFYFSGAQDLHGDPATSTAEATLARLQPVAVAQVAQVAGKSAALLSGQQVYESLCGACHGAGIGGAPKLGDKAAWAPRIAKGYNALLAHAIEGFTGQAGTMPPKGGGSNADVEVARAVAYMANKAGASIKEPVALAAK